MVGSVEASEKLIKIKKVEGDKEELVYSILKLALSKSKPDAELKQSLVNASEARLVEMVESGKIDVIWTGASQEIEAKLLTVRIPVLKGLLGHRIFLIRENDQSRFENLYSLEGLSNLKAGQGTFWGDTKVLKNAQLPTITTIKYNNLFLMLEGGRFDYFPRAVHEPWVEVETRPELNLAVEKNIILIYPYALYFYVNKNNQQLYQDIYDGFDRAIKDGSFDQLFYSNPMIKAVFEKSGISNRRVIRIDNPYMHPDTPVSTTEYWLELGS
ncbi:MAG: hypothetical protein ACPGAE_06670 [Neptuniibacter sp.]